MDPRALAIADSLVAIRQPNGTERCKSASLNEADRRAYSVNEFCEAHAISRAFFYVLQREGKGPRLMKVRGRTLISIEAAADWRRSSETAA